MALPVTHDAVGSFLPFFVCKVAEAVAAGVEEEEVFVHTAEDVVVGAQADVADAVGGHVAAVTDGWFEGLEIVAVITAQSIPRSKPQEAAAVLQQLRDVAGGYAVLRVVCCHTT